MASAYTVNFEILKSWKKKIRLNKHRLSASIEGNCCLRGDLLKKEQYIGLALIKRNLKFLEMDSGVCLEMDFLILQCLVNQYISCTFPSYLRRQISNYFMDAEREERRQNVPAACHFVTCIIEICCCNCRESKNSNTRF